jgi:serine/threonine protein kinase/predicted transcriptional regulator YheO
MTVKCPKCQAENPETKQFCADCGTPLPSAKTSRPEVTATLQTPVRELTTGSTLAGRYQIIEELGKGGMGRVYKVFDTKINEKIALKLIRPEIASDRETIERFSNELKLARKIRHKNVCGMYDIGEAGGARFITMEYIAGEDLKTMIRMSAGFTVGTVLSIGKQVCHGLAEAHRLGVVHRDLKPQNIMIDKDGNAKIMDFGIARSLAGKGITGSGVMIGTPEYMSPEQVEGKEADQRADIYSFGIILYEMVTGRVPFEGDTTFAVALKHKSETPESPRKRNPQISEDLDRLILKCLEKPKERRFQNAEELLGELDRVEKTIPFAEKVRLETKTMGPKEFIQRNPNTQTVELCLDPERHWDAEKKRWALPPALASQKASGYLLWYDGQAIPSYAFYLGGRHLVVTNDRYYPSSATKVFCEVSLPKRGIIYDRLKQKLLLAGAVIVPALLTFLITDIFFSKRAAKTPSPVSMLTISGRPLASYPFYPIAISKEGFLYIDKDKFMEAVNSLRQNPDARASADLLYLERQENFAFQLGDPDRRLFQALAKEAHVPDVAQQEAYRDRLFGVYKQIVAGIGQTFAGTPIEIVLHDFRNPMRSIQAIQNPISGRQLYQPTTNFGLELIKWFAIHPEQGSSFISYDLKLADGTPIKSTSIPLYDSEYGLVGAICMNIRISDISETNLDEKTRQFLSSFRRTSSNSNIEEIIDNANKNYPPKPPKK